MKQHPQAHSSDDITSVIDNVLRAGTSGSANRSFDVMYSLDALYRLKRAQEGTFASGGGGSISNQTRDEQWLTSGGSLGLTQTGNWLNRRVNLNSDSDFTDTGETDETNTFNLPNELKTRDTDSNGTANYTLAYDKNGNQTDDGVIYTYVYDAFGRVRQVKKTGTGALVAEYAYNGLGFRMGW